MQKVNFILVALILLISSCQKEDLLENQTVTVNSHSIDDIHMCTSEMYISDSIINIDNCLRAALLKSNKWITGSTIKMKFLNGDSFLHDKVKKYVREWSMYANLKFQFVSSSQDADIKIAFKWNGDTGSWSYFGTYAKSIAQNKPSMNFGWLDKNSSEAEFSRVILHEFGHALGLIHEHQHPLSNIPWNKTAVYNYYAKQGWSKADVNSNIFEKHTTAETNYSGYDRNSIMHYAVDKSLTTNGYSVVWSTNLSSTDKSFISQQYPYPSNTKGFYRYNISNQYFYTSNFEELRNNYFEQIMGRVYATQVSNTYPIYRYYNTSTGDRLSTLNWNELKSGSGSWRYEGVTGYAYKSQQTNTIPVYRYFRTSPQATHFFTVSSTEVSGGKYGFSSEGVAFYILRN